MRTKKSYQQCGLKGAKIRWANEPKWQERFWTHVERVENGCWHWKLGKTVNGYGKVKAKGKTLLAHRVAFELAGGAITKKLVIRHQCHNRICCNPAHLLSGTHLDNIKDAIKIGRIAKLTEENVKEIRHRKNECQRELGREFKVHHTTISNVITGKHWSHVR